MSIFVVEVGPSAENVDVDRMLAATSGAGPWDTRELHREAGLAIGARARWTVPEDENTNAIVVDSERGFVLVWDGRLDDRGPLCDTLGDVSVTARQRRDPMAASNAELALAAFVKWGKAAPVHLLGDFAFVLFDIRRRALFACRDRFGLRPLYFLRRPSGGVRVASDERALFALGDVPMRPNLPLVARAIAGIPVLRSQTLHEGVNVLPGGAALALVGSHQEVTNYYRPNPGYDESISDADHGDRIRAALEAAVAARIRGRWPVASQASGGLDSSTVAAFAARQLTAQGRPPPLLLHVKCSGLPCDESRFAASLARGTASPLVEVEGSGVNIWDHTPPEIDLGGAWCGPFGELYRQAAGHGVRVILTGQGSDELQSRYGSETEDALLRSCWLEAAGFAGLVADPFDRSAWSRLGRAALAARAPRFVRDRRARRRWVRRIPSYATPRARRWALEGYQELDDFQRSFEHASPLRRAACAELSSTVGVTLILHEHERFASYLGVELSHPFFDQRVVEAFLALPARLRTTFELLKPTQRRVVERDLPRELVWRSPHTVYDEFHRLAWQRGVAHSLELARRSRLAQLGLVEAGLFEAAVRRTFDHPEGPDSDVTNALQLEAWLERAENTRRFGTVRPEIP